EAGEGLRGGGVKKSEGGARGRAAEGPEGTERARVGATREPASRLYEPVIATQPHPAAEAAGTAGILNELEREDLERVLELADLHRIGRHVGEHRRVAVDAVGPGPAAPGRAGEVDEDARRWGRWVARPK